MKTIEKLIDRLDSVTSKTISLDASRKAIKSNFFRHNQRVEEGKEEWALDVVSDKVYFRDNEGNTSATVYEIYW